MSTEETEIVQFSVTGLTTDGDVAYARGECPATHPEPVKEALRQSVQEEFRARFPGVRPSAVATTRYKLRESSGEH